MAALRVKGALRGVLPAQVYLSNARKELNTKAEAVLPIYSTGESPIHLFT
jgi:hypothetical protein